MRHPLLAMTAAAALLCAAPAAFAQATCADMVWSDAVLDVYPDIADACDEVVVAEDGTQYARIDATFHRLTPGGDVIVYVEENDGDRDPVRFDPPEGSTVNIDGVETPWRDLYDRQRLRFYVPNTEFALMSDVDADVMVAEMHDETDVDVDVDVDDGDMDVDVDDEEEIVMPTTASNTGAWLIAGLLMLLAGFGLLARQRN